MNVEHAPIRLIAADLDGTLLDSQNKVNEFTAGVIREIQRKGIVFAACTGRFPENAAMVMQSAGIECPIISVNGAVVDLSCDGPRVFEQFMQADSAYSVFQILESLGEGYFAFAPKTILCRRDTPRHHSELDAGYERFLKNKVSYRFGIDVIRQAIHHPIYKFYVYFDDVRRIAAVRDAVQAIPGVALTQSSHKNLEIMSDQADKGTGLEILAKALGIPQSQTMALGDQHNDLPMIRWAGLGVAMGNASRQVMDQADAVTDSYLNNGAALAMRRYCLGKDN